MVNTSYFCITLFFPKFSQKGTVNILKTKKKKNPHLKNQVKLLKTPQFYFVVPSVATVAMVWKTVFMEQGAERRQRHCDLKNNKQYVKIKLLSCW